MNRSNVTSLTERLIRRLQCVKSVWENRCPYICLCLVLLVACQGKDQYLSIAQREQYLYGTLCAKSVSRSKDLSLQIQQRLVSFHPESKGKVGTNKQRQMGGRSESRDSHSAIVTDVVTPVDLLPATNAVFGWERTQEPGVYIGDKLYYDVPFGNPKQYFRYGFQRQAHVELQSPKLGSRPLILVEVFDMGSPENAYGIFSSIRLPQDKRRMIGSQMAAVMDDQLLFWKGRYLIDIEMYEFATAIREATFTVAQEIEKKIKVNYNANSSEVPLVPLLPKENQVLYSTHLGLNAKLPQRYWPLTDLLVAGEQPPRFVFRTYNSSRSGSGGTDYYGFILEYRDTDTAQQVWQIIRQSLKDSALTGQTSTSPIRVKNTVKLYDQNQVIIKYQKNL
ncbi:MAG: hypothetical protein QGI86_08985 [Candidatus Poribacteria bacterium]|nr:hypothetical protein [Candidatus Poribacteria bacterium]MDP6746528.1 hypothetical protein [Candidatus Poribacteria bacterium]